MRDRKALFAVTTLALLLPIRLMPLLFSACQSGTTGLLRPLSVTAEHSITNTIAIVSQTASSTVPAPYSTAIEAAAAAALALLAAWQGVTHGKVKALEIVNKNGNNKPPV
jgi:Flp pilus assembly protein protease CpaA